jgi:hypothetical protein
MNPKDKKYIIYNTKMKNGEILNSWLIELSITKISKLSFMFEYEKLKHNEYNICDGMFTLWNPWYVPFKQKVYGDHFNRH